MLAGRRELAGRQFPGPSGLVALAALEPAPAPALVRRAKFVRHGIARRIVPLLVLVPVHRNYFALPGIVGWPLVLAGAVVPVPVH